ncbi:uncharacterized protein LOC117382235 [Periophthalmus magnuspinnatus]|uniref:uncharacterized protein LOC117382235 n=1 Tax=Periophthalmus magnuspinnatus TaxID=409849 RepID=UPI0024365573|nr:uncharacterized protein LOC117382235 [Periophthalmus magnuspinnatus]
MSEKKARAAAGQGQLCASSAAAPADFSELWKNVSKLTRGKTPENRKAHASTEHASPRFTDLQSPKRRGRFPGVSNADSPGDLEPSQDIFWDSTSPTQNNAGFRRTKVEISDLVNRIAPKDVKPQNSPLLQWIGDSAVPCTPDIPKQRTKKRLSRRNSVEHLMELARQFDENMQQDKETSEKMNIINNNINKPANPADDKEKVLLAVPCDSGEAELRALFDSSTQKVSGALSQASTSSAGSQKVRPPPVMSLSKKVPETNTCDDFDEAWENQLLSDPLLVALTQNPEQHIATTQTNLQSKSKHISEGESSSANANHVPKVSKEYTKPSYSALQALCPKPKTTNRSTFKLGPDPVVHPLIEPPESTFTALKSSHHTEQKSTAADDFSDSLWDDGDDALLYEVCDSVERISNSQTYKVNQSEQRGQDESDVPKNRLHKPTAPLPIIATNTSANKQPGAFVRSNSLPATSSTALNYQGWNNPMQGSSNKPLISQSLPGNHRSVGSASQFNPNLSTSKSLLRSSHIPFKRNVSDSAVICKKVCVTSEMRGKCSAAEIEKKKQEALARRRQRMQNSQKT